MNAGKSLLRAPLKAGERLVCYCPPGVCQAPAGFSGPCNRASEQPADPRDAVVAAAIKHLDALEEEAKANLALDNAEANFSDARPEIRRAGIAMVAASQAGKELRDALDKAKDRKEAT